MAKKHIVGQLTFEKMKLGDELIYKNGEIISGKGEAIVLNGKYARYTPTNKVIIVDKNFRGKKKEIMLTKPEIKAILKNFKDSR